MLIQEWDRVRGRKKGLGLEGHKTFGNKPAHTKVIKANKCKVYTYWSCQKRFIK